MPRRFQLQLAATCSSAMTRTSENNFQKVGMFSAPENHHPTHHIYHAIHHKLTTKTPPQNTTFPKTTLKNTSKIDGFSTVAMPTFFFRN
jgi:hypothetical protein